MARERIEAITETPQLGRIYTGKVVRVADFGAFVEILPGTDGMVHISQLDSERVEKVEDVCKLGDELSVMVTGIGPDGKDPSLPPGPCSKAGRSKKPRSVTPGRAAAGRPGGGGRPGGDRRPKRRGDDRHGPRR